MRKQALFASLTLYTLALYGSQAMMSVAFGIAVLTFTVLFFRDRSFQAGVRSFFRTRPGRRYLLATLGLVGAFLLSLIAARLFPVNIGGGTPEVRFIPDMAKAVYFLWPLFLAPAFLALPSQELERLKKIWLLGFGVVSCFGVLEATTGFNPRSFFENRPHASFAGLYTVNWLYGTYLTYASVMVFPFLFLLEKTFSRESSRRLIRGTSIALGGIALMATMSRTLWVALPVGVIAFLVLSLRGKARLTALVAIVLIIGGALFTPPVQKRLQYSRGYSQRTNLWKINTEFFKMRPLTGVGWHKNLPLAAAYFDTYLPNEPEKFVGHAHSNLFEFLGGMGLLGLLAWIAWSWVTASLAYGSSLGIFCAWIVFHINGLTQVNFSESKTLHTVLWCTALTLALSVRREENHEASSNV